MNPKISLVFIFILIGLGGLMGKETSDNNVSLINLISTPDKYDGRQVLASGYLSVNDALGVVLYCHKEDYDFGLLKNSIKVLLSPDEKVLLNDFDKSYVMILGEFKGIGEGTYNHSGMLLHVNKCIEIRGRLKIGETIFLEKNSKREVVTPEPPKGS